jgi:hypothetical protein
MTIGKKTRVTASKSIKLLDRWKSGVVCDVIYKNDVRLLQIKWDGDLNQSPHYYLPSDVHEVKSVDMINQKQEVKEQKKIENRKVKRAFESIDEDYRPVVVDDENNEEEVRSVQKTTISMKLECERLLTSAVLTPVMKARIIAIQNEIVHVNLSEEDFDVVSVNSALFNKIYDQIKNRSRLSLKLNEFSGEIAVLTARINVRSLMWRALTELKARVDDAPFAFGCQIKPLKRDHVILRQYPEHEAKCSSDHSNCLSGHRVVFDMETVAASYTTFIPKTVETSIGVDVDTLKRVNKRTKI